MAQSLSDIVELETPNGRTVRVRATTNPRARRLSLTIGAGGPRVSAPEGTHPATVRAFLREHAGWLQKKLRELELTGRKLAPPVPGRAETFTFRGVQLPVIWQHDRFPRISVAPGRLDFALDLEHDEALRIEWDSGHAAGKGQGVLGVLQASDARFEHAGGWVAPAGVDVGRVLAALALGLEPAIDIVRVEQKGA